MKCRVCKNNQGAKRRDELCWDCQKKLIGWEIKSSGRFKRIPDKIVIAREEIGNENITGIFLLYYVNMKEYWLQRYDNENYPKEIIKVDEKILKAALKILNKSK